MADPCKAPGKYMELKTTYKFPACECQGSFLSAVPVVFQAERYRPFLLIDVQDTVVADRYFMGVASQVFDHMFRSSKRWFGIHYPILFEQIII